MHGLFFKEFEVINNIGIQYQFKYEKVRKKMASALMCRLQPRSTGTDQATLFVKNSKRCKECKAVCNKSKKNVIMIKTV